MAYSTAATAEGKKTARSSKILGRSAVTGKFVLRPASKPGSITIEQVRKVVRNVTGQSKKK